MRLDEILLARGVATDKNHAFVIVTEGRVFVEGQKAVSGAQMVPAEALIDVRADEKYVGRGAYKLEGAMNHFKVNVRDAVSLDIGSATGGFTEVLLNNGAKKVYAVDTAKGKLVPKLRGDSRVVVMEGTDIRHLEKLPEEPGIATIDVSLIPLREILPHAKRLLLAGGHVIALLKPQYETRDPKVLRHGIIKTARDRKKIFDLFLRTARDSKWNILDWIESPIKGSEGNVEYLLHIQFS